VREHATATLQSAFLSRRSELGRPLLWSLVGHVALVLAAAGYAYWASAPRIDLNQKPIQARLVRKGTPRDPKLLPRIEEPPPPPQKVEGPKEPVAIPTPQKPAVAIPAVAPDKAKLRASGQEGASKGDARKKLFSAFDRLASQRKPAEELEGDPNGDPEGDSATGEGEKYWGMLSSQVRRNYDVSQTISEQERLRLRAQVHIRVSRSGEVLATSLAKSSGNPLFDNAVLLAVKKSSPLSPPPDALRSDLERSGVILEFTP
jgi:TonB family protein